MARREAVLTPKGSLDWEWFHRERRQKQEWRKAGMCVDCGLRPATDGMVVCRECRKCDDKKIPDPESMDEDGVMTPVMNTPVPTQLRAGVIYLEGYGELWDEMPDGDIPLAQARRHPAYCSDCRVAQYCNHAKRRAAFLAEHQEKGCRVVEPLINLVESHYQAVSEELENDLESWTGRLVEALAAWKSHGLERTRAALAAGAALVEVQRIIGHGRFGDYLATHGVKYRTGRRWMDLYQAGLSAEEVQEKGGIRKAMASLHQASVRPSQGFTPLRGMGADAPNPLAPQPQRGATVLGDDLVMETEGPVKSATVADLPPAEEGKPLVDWTDEDWEEYRNRPIAVGAGEAEAWAAYINGSAPNPPTAPQPVNGMRRCLLCRNNTPRRGSDMCRPCEFRAEGDGSTRVGRLIRENHRLRKAVKGLKWQLYGNAGGRK